MTSNDPRRWTTEEDVISTPISPTAWAFTEGFVPEDEILAEARSRAQEMGVGAIDPGTGAALRFLTAALDARAVVEIGTGTGVSGLWLLRGMRADGVLTTVDVEAEHQRLARLGFTEAGFPAQRARTIPGAALEVLPRLTDSHYDLVLCDADPHEAGAYLDEALRLLRPGGVVVVVDALSAGRVPDPAQRDELTVTLRDLGQRVLDDERLLPVLLPVGDGLLCARLVG
ncbi:O-methyltransferase [Nocardioides bruguierae]|uniref:O-methyltransferase n=1 Tax=Nocardioides bruguierae TaxID=2945102 RepID=UPI002549070D